MARTASTEAVSTMYSGSSASRASTSSHTAQPTVSAVFSAEARVRLVMVEKTGVAWVAEGTKQRYLEPTKLLRNERHVKK